MSRIIGILLLVVMLSGCGEKYPNVEDLPHRDGMINHPTYGLYAKEVPFKQGMTLMPGQEAIMEIPIIFEEAK